MPKPMVCDIDEMIANSAKYHSVKYSDKLVQFVKSRFLAVSEEYYGDSYAKKLILSVPVSESNTTIRRIARMLGFVVYGNSCNHSHDCCGCSFGPPARIRRYNAGKKQIVILEESFSRNV